MTEALHGIIGIIRLDPTSAGQAARALLTAGLQIIEIPLTVAGAPDLVREVRRDLDAGQLVGLGTVLDAEDVGLSIDAGADFLVTPAVRPAVLAAAAKEGIPVVCGAATPTEILDANDLGAALVKLFPAAELGGPSYLRALRGPLPTIPLAPTGGVELELIAAYHRAGANAVGIGSPLVRDLDLNDAGAVRQRVKSVLSAWNESCPL